MDNDPLLGNEPSKSTEPIPNKGEISQYDTAPALY